MSEWRILIGSKSFGKAYPEHLKLLEKEGCKIIPNQVGRAYRAEELKVALKDVDAIVTGTDELTEDVIESANRLKLIAKHGVGLDNIDLDAARKRGIRVAAAFGAVHDSVADLTMALLLAVARGIIPAHLSTVSGQWKGFMGMELRDKTMGIIGLGQIGKEVSLRSQSFGMKVVAFDIHPDEVFAKAHQIDFVSLPKLLSYADVVSLHVGLAIAGPPLLGVSEFKMMKQGAILINTARGHLIDEEALVDALRSGKLSGAGLDVFAKEPPDDSPLLGLKNVVLSPHMGGDTWDARRRLGEITVENILRVKRGENPLFPVI